MKQQPCQLAAGKRILSRSLMPVTFVNKRADLAGKEVRPWSRSGWCGCESASPDWHQAPSNHLADLGHKVTICARPDRG